MTEASPHPRVAYLKFELLSFSAAFIDQLKALRRYDPLVLAVHAGAGVDLAPEALQALSALGAASSGLNHLALRLGRPCPHFEGAIRRSGCRLIHAQSTLEGLQGLALKRRTHLPLVTSFDGGDATRLSRRNPRLLRTLTAAGDLVLAGSESVRKQLLALGCPEEQLRLLLPGIRVEAIPYEERKPADNDAVNLLLVARMVEKKGIANALRAFAGVRRYQRQATLTVIGDGPQRPAVEALLRELGLGDVRLLGAQPHEVVLGEMRRAHIYLQPSLTAADGDSEGIPVALIEAQAAGLPVVATWHGGIPELVADGQSGFLVSERNVHALTERLRHLIEHPPLWVTMGRAGRAVVEERFNLEKQVATLEGYYDELLE